LTQRFHPDRRRQSEYRNQIREDGSPREVFQVQSSRPRPSTKRHYEESKYSPVWVWREKPQ